MRKLVSAVLEIIGQMRTRANDSEELKQAGVRVMISALAVLYITPTTSGGVRIAPPTEITVLFLFYFPFSCLLWWRMKTRPSKRPWRRTIAIFCDMPALTFAMSVGGASMLPIFALLLWVAVGNGLRFGPRHLVASTVVALVSIAVATIFNVYLRHNPYIVVTLTATAVLVPAYIYVLLDRAHRASQAAQEANISKSRFLAQASHDLRQPVHAISLFTACLRDANLQASELQMVDNIDRSLQSVSRLFKSLLDVSTLDSGKVVPIYETIAMAEILEDVFRQNREAAQVADCELVVRKCDSSIVTDRALLTTMLQNIVNNAIKYAPGRSILIGCRREKGTLAVQIYDQGPGILQEHQERVFEEFYQIRERGDRDLEGVGLGLPIVKRLAHLMDMKVRLRSVPGRGTCVTLSGVRVSSRRISVPSQASSPQHNNNIVTGLTVLLVEDDEAVLHATASLLRKWGCEVHEETNVPTQSDRWDLVITDFDLGEGRTGSDCIAAVRALAGWPLPAVVMSGHDAVRVREELADDSIPILSKPVRPAELRSIIMAVSMEVSGHPSD